jgi:hypothetical protein
MMEKPTKKVMDKMMSEASKAFHGAAGFASSVASNIGKAIMAPQKRVDDAKRERNVAMMKKNGLMQDFPMAPNSPKNAGLKTAMPKKMKY